MWVKGWFFQRRRYRSGPGPRRNCPPPHWETSGVKSQTPVHGLNTPASAVGLAMAPAIPAIVS